MIRRLHPDFHIPEYVTNVASEFDGDAFADSLVEAHIDSVVIFAKCMYGFGYWNTTVGKRHPGLGEADFFGEATEACRRRGIEVLAYFYPLIEAALDEDDKWQQRNQEGKPCRFQCPNSEYTETFLLPQMREVTRNYPISGWHVDGIVLTSGGCWCDRCRALLQDAGTDAYVSDEVQEFSRRTIARLAQRMTEAVRPERDGLILSYNNLVKIGCYPQVQWSDVVDIEVYNVLQGLNFNFSRDVLYHGDIGAMRASVFSRHIRTIGRDFAVTTCCRTRGVAVYGSVSTAEELRYSAGLGLALGGYCQFINEMLPEGKMEPPLLTRVKDAYQFVKERERWCIGAEPVRHTAVMGATEPGTGEAACVQGSLSGLMGAARLMKASHVPFDVIDENTNLTPYKVVVLPETKVTAPYVLAKLREYVRNGGVLLATGDATLGEDGQLGLSDVFGATCQGKGDDISYFRLDTRLSANLIDMIRVVRGEWLRVKPAAGVERLAEIVRPRLADAGLPIGHGKPPEKEDSGWPALVRTQFGDGWAAYSPAPIFADFDEAPDEEQRCFLNNIVELVAPSSERPVLIPDLPPSAEISLMTLEGMWILHILRGGEIAPPELRDLAVTLRPDFEPSRVYLAPEQESIPFHFDDSTLQLTLSRVGSHAILVLEP